ncbi:MAG: response regulator transcription factor [Bacteroidota bacterium]
MFQPIDIPAFKALLVDDHIMFSQGLAELIKRTSPNSEINCFSSVDKARAALDSVEYQFLLCDLVMPGSNTQDFITYSRKKYPSLLIIIVSSIMDIHTIKHCFSLGINAYISKAVNLFELRLAFEKTWNGDKYISSDLSGRLASNLFTAEKNQLTKKELEILQSVAAGNSVEKTAELFNVSPYTVLAHRRSIMAKLNLHSAAELVRYAFENKLN